MPYLLDGLDNSSLCFMKCKPHCAYKNIFLDPATPTCANGQYGDGTTCTNCPSDKYSPAWSTSIDVVGDCLNCPLGSTTGGASGQTSCQSCLNGYYGTPPSSCGPCLADKYSATWSGSVDTAADCIGCNANSHTNGQTGQTSCTHCDNGYYGNGATCTACPVNTFSPTWSVSVDVVGDCMACGTCSNTNGQTGQTSCTHCDNGYYGNGATCTACLVNTFSPSWSVSIATASDCTTCNANSHTNGATGMTACTHCRNGCYGDGVTCTHCPVNTFSTTWSVSVAVAGDCTACGTGLSTAGATGQTACTGKQRLMFQNLCIDVVQTPGVDQVNLKKICEWVIG